MLTVNRLGAMVSFPKPRVPRTFRQLELNTKESRWAHADIVPVPKEQQTYTNRAFLGYWIAAGINTTAWALGSSNLANGLDIPGALGGIAVGGVLSGLVAFLCGGGIDNNPRDTRETSR
jgi:nucleobase:cation symporter-1, NCS1 family